jgi:hypothetical protein
MSSLGFFQTLQVLHRELHRKLTLTTMLNGCSLGQPHFLKAQ